MTKSIAREVGTEGITVNAICPGLIITDIIKDNGPATAAPMGISFAEMFAMFAMFASEAAINRPNKVEEVAAVALLLASKEGAGITGALISVDGGTAHY